MNQVEMFEVRATVLVVIAEYRQAVLRTSGDGLQLRITRHTEGVSLDDVRKGQDYLLTITRRLHRVMRAQLLSDTGSASV